MITTTIWIVFILSISFATNTWLTTGCKNTSGGGNYFGGVIVNAYVIYKNECDLKNIRSMSQYESQRQPVISKLYP